MVYAFIKRLLWVGLYLHVVGGAQYSFLFISYECEYPGQFQEQEIPRITTLKFRWKCAMLQFRNCWKFSSEYSSDIQEWEIPSIPTLGNSLENVPCYNLKIIGNWVLSCCDSR